MSDRNGIICRTGKREKLENPVRLSELDPDGTLQKIGFRPGETLCDIGAGSGLFSLAAARLGASKIWAADTDEDILADLKKRAAGYPALETVPVKGCSYPMKAGSADWLLLVTVLHEIEEKRALFSEMRRILKHGGTVCLIEFRKKDTPMGPPAAYRIGAEEAEKLFRSEGFDRRQTFLMGENFYCQTYQPSLQEKGENG